MRIQSQREPSNSVILGSFMDDRSYVMMFTPGDHTGSDLPDKTLTSTPVPPPQVTSSHNAQNHHMERGSTFAAVNAVVEELQHVSEMSGENSITESHQSGDSGTSSVRVDVSSSETSASVCFFYFIFYFSVGYFKFLTPCQLHRITTEQTTHSNFFYTKSKYKSSNLKSNADLQFWTHHSEQHTLPSQKSQ